MGSRGRDLGQYIPGVLCRRRLACPWWTETFNWRVGVYRLGGGSLLVPVDPEPEGVTLRSGHTPAGQCRGSAGQPEHLLLNGMGPLGLGQVPRVWKASG